MAKGTNVYNADGEELGTVDDIMIDKISGKAIYAIMSCGFLGKIRDGARGSALDHTASNPG